MLFFLEETKYTPTLIEGREVVLPAQDGGELMKVSSTTKARVAGSISVDATEAAQNEHRRLVEIDHTIPMTSYKKRLAFYTLNKQSTSKNRSIWMHISHPFQILISFPAVAFTALQYGFLI